LSKGLDAIPFSLNKEHMSELIEGNITVALEVSPESVSDPSVRRDRYRSLIPEDIVVLDEAYVPDILNWLQDSWSEIRKDCSRWIRLRLRDFTDETGKKLLCNLIECLQCGTKTWQAVHGSLLGIAELITETSESDKCDTVQALCLNLVGSNLPPVREAANACVSKLVATGHVSTALLISTILSSISSLCLTCEDIAVANELDGLLGCLSDTIVSSLSSTESEDVDLFRLFKQCDILLSTTSLNEDKEDLQPLLVRVIDTVDLLIGHTSSVVRQHSGQVHHQAI
jgi:hypothetical protein